ncbi:DUF3080 family protein [Marinobacterium mangrovicola]|uniref:DUF3080 family protein n=1 Tax=Marinobacterium mangrovicola TaxID=1476959 RepID=A0A4R1GT83_9GAMM|nr:DUF3080 family protein [Marinobacterium mangrovicola]TCK09479.1 Protein of unknown function (DUF3080) [Marinobacterium mangrovicola]
MRALLLTALLTSLAVSGCSKPTARDMLETYTERVGNALEQEVETDFDLALSQRPAYPPRRERLLEIPDIREGLIDVLDFRHCDLLYRIAERNTSLAKLAPGSQRLIYELEMLPALRECHDKLANSDDEDLQELDARLKTIIDSKQQSLPRLAWNAIYNSEEMEQQFALGAPPLPQSEQGTTPAPTEALQHFADIASLSQRQNWQTPAFTQNLEKDFEQLYRSSFGAEWLTSLALLTHTLEQTAAAIDRRLERRPICFKQQPNNQARIIRNVFQQFYAGQFQPYLSAVERAGRTWREQQLTITQQLPLPPAAAEFFTAVFDAERPDALWHRYIKARDQHTQNWQRLLRQCGMMPGSQS